VQQDSRPLATQAAKQIDTLLILHIRRFGLRIVTFLESYTTFVASTINILDYQTSIDPQAASSRLSLNLEVLRSATSTPSNAKAIDAIERILKKSRGQPLPEHDKGDVHFTHASNGGSHITNSLPEPIDSSRTGDWIMPSTHLDSSFWEYPDFNELLEMENFT
jgi:hypothetical protein